MSIDRGYPASPSLRAAIAKIFPEARSGLILLEGLPQAAVKRGLHPRERPDVKLDYRTRLAAARREIEDHISFLATQLEEFDSEEDTARIRGEAVATLMALRTLHDFLPEAFQDS